MGDPNVFPNAGYSNTKPGLTKRELFAAMAMQAVLANAEAMAWVRAAAEATDLRPSVTMAGMAARFADDLLAELAKEPKP